MMRILRRALPDDADVLGLLIDQSDVTVGGMAAFVAWAEGDPEGATNVRDAEHEADIRKAALRVALQRSFITPLDAEDIFSLSSRLDAVLGSAKDTVREAEVTAIAPDSAVLAMAQSLAEGVGHLSDAFEYFRQGRTGMDRAAAAADAAHKAVRGVERQYRAAMAALLALEDMRLIASRREIYRRLARMSTNLDEVTDGIWRVVVKEG